MINATTASGSAGGEVRSAGFEDSGFPGSVRFTAERRPLRPRGRNPSKSLWQVIPASAPRPAARQNVRTRKLLQMKVGKAAIPTGMPSLFVYWFWTSVAG